MPSVAPHCRPGESQDPLPRAVVWRRTELRPPCLFPKSRGMGPGFRQDAELVHIPRHTALSHDEIQGCAELAGEPGFEPRQTESESVVLPLHHSPTDFRTITIACKEVRRLSAKHQRKSAFLASRSSIRSPRGLASGLGKCGRLRVCDRAFGAGRVPATTLPGMHASCEPQQGLQPRVAHFRRKRGRLLRQIIEPHVAAGSLARLGAACNVPAPQKRGRAAGHLRARFPQLAQSLHRVTRMRDVFLGATII